MEWRSNGASECFIHQILCLSAMECPLESVTINKFGYYREMARPILQLEATLLHKYETARYFKIRNLTLLFAILSVKEIEKMAGAIDMCKNS
jgi:hypothetical protein